MKNKELTHRDESLVECEAEDIPLPSSEITRVTVEQVIGEGGNLEAVSSLTNRSVSNIRRSLRSKGGKEYLRWLLEQQILETAPRAISELTSLMRGARSEKVRYESAVELLRLAEYGTNRADLDTPTVTFVLNVE